MPVARPRPSNEIRPQRKLRWQFGLKALFVLLTVAAWCTWQWTITRQRQATIAGLHALYIPTFHDSVVAERGAQAICTSIQWSDDRIEEPIRPGLVASITGWENMRGVTVFVSPAQLWVPVREDQVALLSKLPGLSRVVIWDANPKCESWPEVIEFKKTVRERLPHVEISHIHDVVPRPVG